MKSGEVALIKEAKLLDKCSSATVVIPFAMMSIIIDKIICILKFFQPIHFNSLVEIRIIATKTAAKNCRIPATNQGGIVSTAILIPKNVVPQTKATVKIAKMSLGSLNMNEIDLDFENIEKIR